MRILRTLSDRSPWMFAYRTATIAGLCLLGCNSRLGGLGKADDHAGSDTSTDSGTTAPTTADDSGTGGASGSGSSGSGSTDDSGSDGVTGPTDSGTTTPTYTEDSGTESTTGSTDSGTASTSDSGTDGTTGSLVLTDLALLVTGNVSGFIEPCG